MQRKRLVILLVGVLGCAHAMMADAEKVNRPKLQFEPQQVHLKGRLRTKTFFGPPGYGENPATGAKENPYILTLDTPIDVVGNPEDELNTGTIEDVREVTIVFDGNDRPWRSLLGKHVDVQGSLFSAHTGHHHTPVLITAVSVSPIK